MSELQHEVWQVSPHSRILVARFMHQGDAQSFAWMMKEKFPHLKYEVSLKV